MTTPTATAAATAVASAVDPPVRSPRPPAISLVVRRPRILLVEDDDELRRLIAAALRQRGYDVVEVADGNTGLAYLNPWLAGHAAAPPPDAVVSDIRVPGWSGLEILAAVREAGLTLPVVLVTAFGSHTTHAAAQRLGASAMLDKPFQIDGLCRVVRDALAAR